MKHSTWWGLSLVGLIALCGGCSAPLSRFESALEEAGVARFGAAQGVDAASASSVEVRASLEPGARAGRGAVVSDRHVLTVEHVLEGQDRVFVATVGNGGWVAARVVRRERGNPEPLVLLELEVDGGAYGLLLGFDGFDADDVLAPGTGAPATVVTGRGQLAWAPGVLQPGDSGSPVLDAAGTLIGIVSGRRGAQGVYVALQPASPAAPTLLAAAR